MISLDTNVVIRILAADDADQTRRAVNLLRTHSAWIPKTVLLESEWVLRYSYGLDRQTVVDSTIKLRAYARAGVPHYWALDPA